MTNHSKSLQSIEAIDLQSIQEALEVLNQKLLPYLQEASNEEKLGKAKLSTKGLGFVTKSYEYTKQYPSLLPSYLDKETIRLDIEKLEALRQLYAPLKMLTKATEDSLLLIGSEAYTMSLSFYDAIKTAAKNNVPGAQVVYDDLKNQFSGQAFARKKKQDPETPE